MQCKRTDTHRRACVAFGVVFVIASYSFAADVGRVEPLHYGAGPLEWTGDLTPISEADWTYERAGHLLERAGFGGTPEAIEALASMSPEEAVDSLIQYGGIPNDHLPPFEESGIWDEGMLPDVNDNFDFRGGVAKAYATGEVYGVKPNENGVRRYQPIIDKLYYRNYATRHEWERATVWWAHRMLNTHRPLEEKMTLFWHDHFATEQEKIRDYRTLLDLIATFRENATGNFGELLLKVSQDPAMMVYLDNRKNVKGHANENFAREIMELFSLGVGNYTEDDVKEAARAFTGWGSHGREFVVTPDLHDDTEKTVLGETGNFDGTDMVEILLRQEVCAEYISGKLYRFLVREDLSPDLNTSLARILRDGDYEIKPLLKTLFLSRDFYSPESYASQIKDPVHFLVSTYVKLGLEEVPGIPNFTYVSSMLGQALGNPPNVAGWEGGRSWINPSTLMARGNIMRHLLFPREAEGEYDLGPFAGRYQRYVNAHVDVLERDRQALLGPSQSMGGEEMADSSENAMMAPSAKMINETPDYDLPFGVFNGKSKAFEIVRPPVQAPARLSLSTALKSAGVLTTSDAVTYMERLLLRLPLSEDVRGSMAAFLTKRLGKETIPYSYPGLENDLREVMHLIMSTPEFQLA